MAAKQVRRKDVLALNKEGLSCVPLSKHRRTLHHDPSSHLGHRFGGARSAR